MKKLVKLLLLIGLMATVSLPSASVTPAGTTGQRKLLFDPAWSPDGMQIVFSADDYTGFVADIFVMNRDGSNRKALLTKLDSLEYSVDWQR